MFHITIECSMAFGRWLEGGFVLQQVYASRDGGINYTSSDGRKWHINNKGVLVERTSERCIECSRTEDVHGQQVHPFTVAR